MKTMLRNPRMLIFLSLFIPTIGLTAVCDSYSGLAYNSCYKFCVTQDCINTGGDICEKTKVKFQNATGETFVPCRPNPCPCVVNGITDLESVFLPLAGNESYLGCTTTATTTTEASIMIINDLGERQRQMFARPNELIGNFCRIEFPATGELPIHIGDLTDEELMTCKEDVAAYCNKNAF